MNRLRRSPAPGINGWRRAPIGWKNSPNDAFNHGGINSGHSCAVRVCLMNDQTLDLAQIDQQEKEQAEVSGKLTFVIKGRPPISAQPQEVFAAMIDPILIGK